MAADVWGPLLGTVVGGLIAALVAWRTTVSQWRRQRLDRRHDLIERHATDLQESAGRLALQMGVDNVERDAVERVLFDTTVLVARAREGAPHLASVLADLMDGLQDQIGKTPWKDQPTSPWVSSGLERGEPFAWGIAGAALHWLRDPKRFETAKPAASFFLESAQASGLDDSLAVPTGDLPTQP